MTGEKCRHCGGRIEYVERTDEWEPWWAHVGSAAHYNHEAAPAFGGGS